MGYGGIGGREGRGCERVDHTMQSLDDSGCVAAERQYQEKQSLRYLIFFFDTTLSNMREVMYVSISPIRRHKYLKA